jgi:peptidoglycan-N-acetylglucosamine deacetylase
MKNKPICSVSLDLDNQWSYMKIHGDNGWQNYPSYLDIFLPHVLNALKELQLSITFFVVGQDAALEKNRKSLELIADYKHEFGNHSFNHESWLHLYPKEKIEEEIIRTNECIYNISDTTPVGFRGPGFSWSHDLLNVLSENNFLYDASSLPTFIGPFARAYYFRTANLNEEEKKTRAGLFGSFKDGFKPLKPYYWNLNSGKKILEIPVTTMPIFKLPFHLSYLIYLCRISKGLMEFYLNTAILLCKATNISPSFLLHPLDLIGGDKIKELAFFPGMDVSSNKKLEIFFFVINSLKKHFQVLNMSSFAKEMQNNQNLRNILTNQ